MTNAREFENRLAYIHGRIEAEIEGFAASMGVPKQFLASRLAELLHPAGVGRGYRVPILPRNSTNGYQPVEQKKVGARARTNKAPGTRRVKMHWTQRPENRKRVAKQLRRMHRAWLESRRAA